jgi:protein involved in polysaccharide export with SLBB domain
MIIRLLFLLLLPAVGGALCAQPDPQEVPSNAPLRKGDALLVHIEGIGNNSLPAYREVVDSAGHIELPFLSQIVAENKTPTALADEMAAAYAHAGIAEQARVTITYITHFDPAPNRSNLVRLQDPRRPAPLPPAP